MTDPLQVQMQGIRNKWGGVISDVCKTTSVRPEFLAALIANESGGDTSAKRFEPAVLVSLWQVLAQRKEAFGSITRDHLVAYLYPAPASFIGGLNAIVAGAVQRLDGLATSWGLTQIMGYNVLGVGDAGKLADPTFNLRTAVAMLLQFSHRFDLDVIDDTVQLLRCWNTGRPDGTTADPEYINHGTQRMVCYIA